MSQAFLAGVALLALATNGSAFAADAPLKSPVYTKTLPAAQIYNWTGCYAGLHAGGGTLSGTLSAAGGNQDGGGLAGGQIGCNLQSGQIVWGIEGEAAWSNLAIKSDITSQASSFESIGHNRWSADLAARAGFALDRALIYGKVGAATGGFAFSLGPSASDSGNLTGLLLGLGVEYAFAPNWSAKLEYDHIDYLSRSFQFTTATSELDLNESASANVVKGGINYRFGGQDFAPTIDASAQPLSYKAPATKAPPGAAFDWTGCYLGLQAGGGVLSDSFNFGENVGGGLVGGQIGCNLQTGQIVLGIEGEAAWSGLADKFDDAGSSTSGAAVRNRWSADLAARAGVAVDRALIYGKVGMAQGQIEIADFPQGISQRASGALTGLVFGAGFEYALAPRWSVKLEYDYIGYLGRALPFNTVGRAPFDFTVSDQTNLVKAGVNYQLMGARTGDRAFVADSHRAFLPAASTNWSGCYAGVHGGGALLNDPFADFNGSDGSESGGGVLAGGQAGCNIQTGQIVWGVEGEAWSGLAHKVVFNVHDTPVFGPGSSNQFTTHNRWNADLAARAGLAVGRALIYGKVGIAEGRFEFAQNFNNDNATFVENGSSNMTGVIFGAGLEYAFAPNWSAKLEYNHIDYRARAVSLVSSETFTGSPTILSSFNITETATVNVAKVGVNYQFGGPNLVSAKY